MQPVAGGLIIRRACPECGAPIRHAEGDGGAACGYCGLRFAIVRSSAACPAFVVPPRPATEELLLEAKRALRRAQVRLRELSPPRLLYAPFYRMLADTWLCYRDPPPAPDSPSSDLPFPDEPPPGEVRFEVGSRDLTLDAGPRTHPWRRGLGLRVQACEATPLPEVPAAEGLPVRLSLDEARSRLLVQLEAAGRRESGRCEQRLFAPEIRLMLLYAPGFIIPFHDGFEPRGVILDGLSGRTQAILSGGETERLLDLLAPLAEDRGESLEEVRAGSEGAGGARNEPKPARRSNAPLVPLVCPECSAPMPLLPRAHLHCCPICLRLWSPGIRGLRFEPMRLLRPAVERRPDEEGGADRTWLPFYRLRGRNEALLAPAFHGRHPRAVWNFTLSLNRRRAEWTEDPAEGRRPGALVERAADAALALAPFLSFCLERDVPFSPVAADLVWMGFSARGPDWVQPALGLGFPRTAVTPWTLPVPPSPAARTG